MIQNSIPFSGGTAKTIDQARRICAAESIERAFFNKLFSSSAEEKNRFFMNEYPTSCGFAAGFDKKFTVYRAVCEAVERWAWSKWIDNKIGLTQVTPKLNTDLSQYFYNQFDKVIFFQVPLSLSEENRPSFIGENFYFSVAIGIKDNGIFPGSRVTTEIDECWEHCLLEAWRHQVIYDNELRLSEPANIFDKRIQFYGQNGIGAIKKLLEIPPGKFPVAKIRLLEEVASSNLDSAHRYHVWRSLCEDFIGWDRGDENRFVY
ncbi:MAG: hypothetical protein ACXVB4_16965 [Pseudobdellovibrionaceae bacterium]